MNDVKYVEVGGNTGVHPLKELEMALSLADIADAHIGDTVRVGSPDV